MTPEHILYSFRRCPYAMRARVALMEASVAVVMREIELKQKPDAMLAASPKGTVPVLITSGDVVVDESLDIMRWAFEQASDDTKAVVLTRLDEQLALIHHNDTGFKPWLDRYKYHVRHPEQTRDYYRTKGELFLQTLEDRLATQEHLFGAHATMADMAIFPFVRQFKFVDQAWFDEAPYPATQAWLETWLTGALFKQVMTKYTPWRDGDDVVVFG